VAAMAGAAADDTPKTETKKLWGGRFSEVDPDPQTQAPIS